MRVFREELVLYRFTTAGRPVGSLQDTTGRIINNPRFPQVECGFSHVGS